MSKHFEVPWEKIYDYVMECGCVHDPYRFVATALEEIGTLIPYDEGLAYYLDESRRVRAQHLVNIKSRWSTMYLEYYSRLESTTLKLDASANEMYGVPLVKQIIWSEQPPSEFIANYIMARGVKCSLGFALFDQYGQPRATFSLDRLRKSHFTDAEVTVARLAIAQIGNLYKNFFTSPDDIPGQERAVVNLPDTDQLTKREREIVGLLCQGLSPAHVAKTLNITVSTAYKHISHIYKKLNVSSQQELLVRFLGASPEAKQ